MPKTKGLFVNMPCTLIITTGNAEMLLEPSRTLHDRNIQDNDPDTVTDLEMPDTRHSVLSFKWHGLKRRAVVRRDIKIDSLTLDLGPLEMWDQP